VRYGRQLTVVSIPIPMLIHAHAHLHQPVSISRRHLCRLYEWEGDGDGDRRLACDSTNVGQQATFLDFISAERLRQ
jgi:hypothetical protein